MSKNRQLGRREFIGGCLATAALACSVDSPTTHDSGQGDLGGAAPPDGAAGEGDGPLADSASPDAARPDAASPDAASPDGSALDATPLPGFEPDPLVGFGAKTTGGRGGRVVVVTSLSDNPAKVGSLRWALEQHKGEPLYVCLAVEGAIKLGEPLDLTRPDLTLDGRFAPGAGCWMTTNRLVVKSNNVLLDNLMHFGNDTGANADSDCLGWGVYDKDPSATDHVTRGYARRCEFHHGRDEVVSVAPRSNNQATGNKVRQLTWERCLIANPTGVDHEFGVFIGDGTEKMTLYRNLMFNFAGRYPFVRQYTLGVELINNASFNFNENCLQVVEDAEVSYRGNLLRLGPRWKDPRAPILIQGGAKTYAEDVRIDSKIGKSNSHGLTRGGGKLLANPSFAGSGLAAAKATTVASLIADDCGARLHGGGRNAIAEKVLAQFTAGDAPKGLATHPGPTPNTTGASYPAHTSHVPKAYLALYPADTDLGATIADGSAWTGYLVAERVGAWLIRES